MNQKSIIILGTGGSARLCDFRATEVWGVNGAWTMKDVLPEKDRETFRMVKLFMTDYLWSSEGVMNFDIVAMNKFAEENNMKMYTLHRHKIGRYKINATELNYKKIVDYFGSDYFTDTITYMIAYALYTHTVLAKNEDGVIRPELTQPLKLLLFGVDMATKIEYACSKGGIEFWLGQARAMGAEIFVAQGSVILAHPRGIPYGWKFKINKNIIDPENILGDKSRKRAPTGSERIQGLIKEGAGEELYGEQIE